MDKKYPELYRCTYCNKEVIRAEGNYCTCVGMQIERGIQNGLCNFAVLAIGHSVNEMAKMNDCGPYERLNHRREDGKVRIFRPNGRVLLELPDTLTEDEIKLVKDNMRNVFNHGRQYGNDEKMKEIRTALSLPTRDVEPV